jgi:thiosulfate/3-mercaptopyruvate sulfurtransferase
MSTMQQHEQQGEGGRGYAHPEALVDTAWVAEHLDHPGVRLVEVDVDTTQYEHGHVPGAVGWNWSTQLCDTVVRDIIPKAELEKLLSASGIDNNSTIVLYGDNNNWFAAWAFWQLKVYGHEDVRIMDGGRRKWLEEGRELTVELPNYETRAYEAREADPALRAWLPQVQTSVAGSKAALVDVRSPAEFTGEILAPPGLPETCQRGGHIPGAKNIPWGKACNEDGTFKSAEELDALYRGLGVTPDRPVITYCRIGERSSHSWFALKYLLGYPDVRNYDGSWTEWGNMVGAAVEKP